MEPVNRRICTNLALIVVLFFVYAIYLGSTGESASQQAVVSDTTAVLPVDSIQTEPVAVPAQKEEVSVKQEPVEENTKNSEKPSSAKKKKKSTSRKSQTVSHTETYNGHTVYTGPRGGKYYYNSNGNKVYIRR